MPLEWIFGSKKKSDPHSQKEAIGTGEDDFVFLERNENIRPTRPTDSNKILPYSVIPVSSSNASQIQEVSIRSFIHGVPFKLTNANNISDDIDSIAAFKFSVAQNLKVLSETIGSGALSYSFTLENGILREADNGTN